MEHHLKNVHYLFRMEQHTCGATSITRGKELYNGGSIYHICTSLPTYLISDTRPVLATAIGVHCASSYVLGFSVVG